MRSSINSFELMQLKPTDRFSLLYYRVFDEIRYYNSHRDFLERVMFFESMLKPLWDDLKPLPKGEEYGPHTKGYKDWRKAYFDKVSKDETSNFFAVGHDILGELNLVARESGLIGGDDAGFLAVVMNQARGEAPSPTVSDIQPNEDDI